MPHPVRHATESANISPSTTPDVYIRRWAIKHLKLSILRKEHHPLIKCRFFCLDKGVHLKPSKHDIIEIELDPKQHTSLYDLISALSDYLDDLMWLISFLSKKYVHWYQLDMFYKPQVDVQEQIRTITAYREPIGVKWNPVAIKSPGFENHPSDLLIQLKSLNTS